MENFQIVVENSAPSQARPAKSVQWACELIKGNRDSKVLDFGCGRLRNLSILNSYYDKVIMVDTQLQCEKIRSSENTFRYNQLYDIETFKGYKGQFDITFLICVLHTVPDIEIREKILDITYLKLKRSGLLVVDVPQGENYYRMRMTPRNRFKDGYVFGAGSKKTFYKNYHASELDDFITKGARFDIYKKKYFDKHLVRIYKRCDENGISK